MAQPSRFDLRATIQPGSVCYFHDSNLTSPDPHYFIIINKNPLTDRILLLVCSSSQLEAVRKRRALRPETVVEISPLEYPDFTRDSNVDCNTVFEKSIRELQRKYDSRQLRVQAVISPDILEKLRDAVLESDMVDGEVQDMLIL
jgi:hypothetical protein